MHQQYMPGWSVHSAAMFRQFGSGANTGPGLRMNAIVSRTLLKFGTDAQKTRWLPSIASGGAIAAIAMTEPGTGSDLRSVRTRADWRGDCYVINGAKTFMSNGLRCDVVIVVARTDPALDAHCLSLFIVDTSTKGIARGPALERIGMEGWGNAEMVFSHCAVQADCLLGGVEGRGVGQLAELQAF